MYISSLKNDKEFTAVNKGGSKIYTPYFILIIKNNFVPYSVDAKLTQNNVFLGIKVSRKVGKATLRNKIKRRIRHLVRLLSTKLKLGNYGIIFVPRKSLASVKFSLLIESIDKILNNYYQL